MSTLDWALVRRLFDEICELPPSRWDQALRDAGASAEVAAEILALCDAQTRGIGLPRPVMELLSSLDPELEPGTRLGPWRILSTLAEGGMGRVYRAERADGQYQLQVAIKRLRALGQPGEELMLKRERQILADLAHPNIARLLDGGMTPNGQPHLVMEFIEGERIDRWCAQRRLDLPARLRMFQQVCRAVGFAHRHLVLHCDLKPSNILVRPDGSPVLLDFGIARLADADARDAQGHGYMTPRYASPEQKRGDPLSAATDIYSLGLILSELVAPDAAPADGAEPTATPPTQPPSGRAERARLPWARRLRGDLDSIVMRACAPLPEQRHPSAEALADDIQAWFEHRPVSARAHQRGYRSLRLLHRRWPAFAAGALVLALSSGFTWSLFTQLERAREAERSARLESEKAQAVVGFLLDIFDRANPETGASPDTTARTLMDSASAELQAGLVAQPELRLRLSLTLGKIYERMGLPAQALALVESAHAAVGAAGTLADRLELLDLRAHALEIQGDLPAALAAAGDAVKLAESELGPNDLALANALNTYGMLLNDAQRHEEAVVQLQQALPIRVEMAGEHSFATAATLHNLGIVTRRLGRLDESEAWLQRALAAKAPLVPDDHPRVLTTLQVLALLYRERGELERAAQSLDYQRELRLRRHGENSAILASLDNERANLYHDLGRYAEADVAYRQSIRAYRAIQGEDSADAAVPLNNLASLLEARGDFLAALALFEESLAIRRERFGPDHLATVRAHNNRARVLLALGRLEESRAEVELAYAKRLQQLGPAHLETLGSRILRARLAIAGGELAPAADELNAVRSAYAGLPHVDVFSELRLLEAEAELAQAGGARAQLAAVLDQALALAAGVLPEAHPQRLELALRRQALLPSAERDRAQLRAAAETLELALVDQHPARQLLRSLLSG